MSVCVCVCVCVSRGMRLEGEGERKEGWNQRKEAGLTPMSSVMIVIPLLAFKSWSEVPQEAAVVFPGLWSLLMDKLSSLYTNTLLMVGEIKELMVGLNGPGAGLSVGVASLCPHLY